MNENPQIDLAENTITLSPQPGEETDDELIGKQFAQKYEILSLLGRGGMSVVYLARHLAMNKIVALKILQMHLTKDENAIKGFRQEAQTASNLKHQGIVEVTDCGEGDNG